jgi:hypothetical protein
MDIWDNPKLLHPDLIPYLLRCIICGEPYNREGQCLACERANNVSTEN